MEWGIIVCRGYVVWVPPESIPKLYFLAKAIEEAPETLRITRGGSISMIRLVKWLRSNKPDLYRTMMEVYGCDDSTCLARSMSQLLIRVVLQNISLEEPPRILGDLKDAIRMESIWKPRG